MLPHVMQALLERCLLHPQLSRLGFTDMGIGIERRRSRFRKNWDDHIKHCFEVQRLWHERGLSGTGPGRSLLVLGAGRLYDLDLRVFKGAFSRLVLVDADPLAQLRWSKLRGFEIDGRLDEFSGVLAPVEQILAAMPKRLTWNEALKLIEQIPERLALSSGELPQSSFLRYPADAAVSLNVLSQIPIMYQDLVERALSRRFFRSLIDEREDEWIAAIGPLCGALVRRHLRDLAALKRPVLLITDAEYCRYEAPADRAFESCPLVLSARPNPTWEPVRGATVRSLEVSPALYGVDTFSAEWAVEAGFSAAPQFLGEWLWHVQPAKPRFFRAGLNRGTINRVRAFALSSELGYVGAHETTTS